VSGNGFFFGQTVLRTWNEHEEINEENLEARRFKKAKNPEWNDFEYRFLGKKPSPNFELSKHELYVRVEAPKGELGIYLVGDDSLFPWRWKICPPGFINLQILPQLVKK
jgi:NAD(P)H-quinone oxidoreductase subunit H